MGAGHNLERLVAYLRQRLAHSETALVESPKFLRSVSTGRMRRYDAVLTIFLGSHTCLTAIECRDRSRPAGPGHVEAFARKCSVTTIHTSVMVSPFGFTGSAISRAKELGIHCLSPDDIETFPWLKCSPEHHQIRVHYSHIDFTIITGEGPEAEAASYTLINDDGETISTEVLRDYLFSVLLHRQRKPSDMKPGDSVERIRLFPSDLSIIDADTGLRRKVRQINLVAHCTNEAMKTPFMVEGHSDIRAETTAEHLARLAKESGIPGARISMHRTSN